MVRYFWDGLKILIVFVIFFLILIRCTDSVVFFWDWALFRYIPGFFEDDFGYVKKVVIAYMLTVFGCVTVGFLLNSSLSERCFGIKKVLTKLSELPVIGFPIICLFGSILYSNMPFRLVKVQFPLTGRWTVCICTGVIYIEGSSVPKWKVVFISGQHTLIDTDRRDLIVFLKDKISKGIAFVLSLTMNHASFTVDEYPEVPLQDTHQKKQP